MAPRTQLLNTARLLAASLAMLAIACSSGDDDEPADSADDRTPEATPTTAPAQARTPQATATAAGGAPSFTAGKWADGEATVTVSGGATLTLKGKLLATSSSEKNSTRLIFADGVKTISISISKEFQPFAMSVYDGVSSIRTGSSDQPCKVTYKQSDDKRVEGTFRCEDARVEVGGSGNAVIEGTFLATR